METRLDFNPNPPFLSDEFIYRASQLSTPLLSDVMGCFGAMDYTIKPVSLGMRVCGTAVTVNLRAGDNLFLHQAIYSSQKGYVLIVDGKGHTRNAPLGEILTRAAMSLGLNGIVLDGVARDRSALIDLKFPIFTKGFVPTGGDKDGPGELNVPISCGGVSVQPGDLVLGDDDGVVIVPRDRIHEVISLAEKKAIQEQERMRNISNGNVEPSWLNSKLEKFRA